MSTRPMKEDPMFLIKFIRLIEKYPCLWNYTLKEYSKRDDIDLVWKSIAAELNDTEHNCRDRWRNIRCAFVRSQKLPLNGKPKKAYYLAKHLSFLLPYTKGKVGFPHQLNTNCDNSTDGIGKKRNPKQFPKINLDPLRINVNTDASTSSIKKEVNSKKLKLSTLLLSTPDDKSFEDNKQNINEDDPDLLFFRSLLPDMKKLADKQKRTFKRKVLSLLDEFLDENEFCTVTTPPSTTSSVNSTRAWVTFESVDEDSNN